MISELNDQDLVEFLMTTDYEQEYNPEELKYMLLKFRNFYRVLYSKYNHLSDDKDVESNKYNDEIEFYKNQIDILKKDIIKLDDKINKLKNRKLSFKERISGKIKNI